jgi:hypothetical protein
VTVAGVVMSRPPHHWLGLECRVWWSMRRLSLSSSRARSNAVCGSQHTAPHPGPLPDLIPAWTQWAVNQRTTPAAAKKTVPVRLSPPSEHDRLRILPSLSARLCQEDPNRATGPIHYHLLQLRATHTLPLLRIDRRSDRIHTLNLPRPTVSEDRE